MNEVDRSIIATLAYYGSFSWPLTLLEIAERLIPASRLGGRASESSVGMIAERLERLRVMGVILQEEGLYALVSTAEGFGGRRIEQEKIWAQKWRRMLRRARWLQVVPFVRGLYASGSLAMGNMSSQSDWDFFIIAQRGRLYTARIGLLATAWAMRALRTKKDTHASDTFCFNHYVTTGGLEIRHRSLYVAHGLAMLVPVHDSQRYLEHLWQANQWIGDYRPMPNQGDSVRRSVRPSRMLSLIRSVFEKILMTPVGDRLERILKTWQQRRIAREPATRERGGRVVADDQELEFHPRSFEAVALARYNAAIVHAGFTSSPELDSGLAH